MRHSLWFRALVGIWGLWFTAAISEVGGIHACAVHDGNAASAVASHGNHGASHADMVAAMQHQQDTAGNSSTPPEHDHGGACTCLGMCCFAAPVAPPTSAITIVDVVLSEAQPPVYAAVLVPSVERAYVQPFANGPPARA